MFRRTLTVTVSAIALLLFAGSAFAATSCQPTGGCFLLTNGNDMWTGTNAGECVGGAGGDDQMNGRGGPDRLHGGPGNDLMHGQNGDDCVRGGPGLDTVTGGNGVDRLEGGNDGLNDNLIGSGNDCCVDENLGVANC